MATPDFILQMRQVRREILAAAPIAKAIPELRNDLCTAMRAMNIIGAFTKGNDITSVESGNINNRKFVRAMQSAINFMREYAEAETNRQFDQWTIDNILEDDNDIIPVTKQDRVLVF